MDRIKLRLRKDVNIGDFVAKDENGWYKKVERNKAERLVTEDRLIDISNLVKDAVVDFSEIDSTYQKRIIIDWILLFLVATSVFAFVILIGH